MDRDEEHVREYAVAIDGSIVWLETADDYAYLSEMMRDNVPDPEDIHGR